ncbi:MAG: hypothetical protein LBF89_07665, partial [Bacteroidales bacterium]|nr:hypothetical protein [Bacteroidales bacterium]
MEVSTKNTKTEILEAYEKLLKEVQQAKTNVPRQVQEEKQKQETVKKVADVTQNSIMNDINSLKSGLNKSLDDILSSLACEFQQLEDLRSAIKIEKQTLEDLYGLSANTDSLAAMLLAQKEKQESFEMEMNETKESFASEIREKKAQWEDEKSKQKAEEKEYLDELNRKRKREEEEYQYKLKVSRQKEQDDYDTEKSLLEKELTEKKNIFDHEIAIREATVKNAEAELEELRKNNAIFPEKLEKALADQKQIITENLQTKYDFDLQLIKSQNQAEIRLKDQIIKSLQEKIQELQSQ